MRRKLRVSLHPEEANDLMDVLEEAIERLGYALMDARDEDTGYDGPTQEAATRRARLVALLGRLAPKD